MTGPVGQSQVDAPVDRRAARVMARTQAETLAADAAVERRARERELALQVDRQRAEFDRQRREADRAEAERATAARRQRTAEQSAQKAERTAQRRAARAQRRGHRRIRRTAALKQARQAAPAVGMGVLTALPIGMAMSVAWIGQIGFALHVLAWPVFGAVLFAGGLEASTLLALGLYIRARRAGDRGTAPRLVALGLAVNAAAMNYWHATPHRAAVAFAAMSLVAPGLTELVASERHRAALRDSGRLPARRPRFGVAHWLRFPVRTFTAWSLALRDGVTTTAAALAVADRELAGRTGSRRRLRRARMLAGIEDARMGQIADLVSVAFGLDTGSSKPTEAGSEGGAESGSGDSQEPTDGLPAGGSEPGSRRGFGNGSRGGSGKRARGGSGKRTKSLGRHGSAGDPVDLVDRAAELLQADANVSARTARRALGVRHAAAQTALEQARCRLAESDTEVGVDGAAEDDQPASAGEYAEPVAIVEAAGELR